MLYSKTRKGVQNYVIQERTYYKILEGKKTMTSRKKKLCAEGEVTNLMANKDYSKVTGKYIKITVYQKILGKFTDEDSKREGFENLNELKRYWEKNIGFWIPSTVVWVHEFEIVKIPKPKKKKNKPFLERE